MNETMEMLLGNKELSKSENIANKKITCKNGAWAEAVMCIVKDRETGEIVNGACYMQTSGGLCYPTKNYAHAIKIATEQVQKWENNDFDWTPESE